jgi:acetoin utilization protein AcuB
VEEAVNEPNALEKAGTALVSDWMTRAVVSVKQRDTLLRARHLVVQNEINQLPVVKDGKMVGILTDRDIRDAYPSSLTLHRGVSVDAYARAHFVEEVMTYNVVTVSPNSSIQDAAILLWRNRIGGLPVVDEGGKLVGIFTRSDVIKALIHAGGTPVGKESLDPPQAARSERREKQAAEPQKRKQRKQLKPR